jgi:hypothetical protein
MVQQKKKKLQELDAYLGNPQHTMYPQIVGAPSDVRLEYLQLQKSKPKPIATYEPEIDDEFLLHKNDKKKPVDEKILKRKIKEHEKVAVREIRKDTLVLQKERARESQLKKDLSRGKIFKGGNGPKDEI